PGVDVDLGDPDFTDFAHVVRVLHQEAVAHEAVLQPAAIEIVDVHARQYAGNGNQLDHAMGRGSMLCAHYRTSASDVLASRGCERELCHGGRKVEPGCSRVGLLADVLAGSGC